MIYGSVCSGIEAASVAWDPLGWRAAFLSEIDPFPRAVLSHRFPGVPLHGDFTTIDAGQYEPIDLLVGGTPCQSFSVAGLRGGLGDDRGNLALEYLRLADRLRPRWLVWENVPGVLSSGGGRDFGSILGGMGELGYGFAYRVLDAQYVRVDGLERAVPQRRRRVFVVGYSGDWRRAAAVFFERESLCGHPAPHREAGKRVARPIAAGSQRGSGYRNDADTADNLIASTGDISHCLNAGGMGRIDYETETMIAHSLRASGFDASEDGTGRGTPLVPIALGWQNSASQGDSVSTEITPSLDKSKTPAVAMPADLYNLTVTGDVAATLATEGGGTSSGPSVLDGWAVRRLTPTECERLQGFPDGWTDVPYRGKPAADGPRYKALGNSMAVNVMRWIGTRIALVESLEAASTL